jgi:hypothetical protein
MNCNDVQELLNDYLDGGLVPDDRRSVEAHLTFCETCAAELRRLQRLLEQTSALPRTIQPERDIWVTIEGQIRRAKTDLEHRRNGVAEPDRAPLPSMTVRKHRSSVWPRGSILVAASIAVIVGVVWFMTERSLPSWQVESLEGTPRIGSSAFSGVGKLRVGEALVTDQGSRARVEVGLIGHVDVDPASRLRLVNATLTEHRLALDRGTIHAVISAPPRLFLVETPSALAVDLGCAYTLSVDSTGASVLQVTSGWVALEFNGRESIVPAGAMATTRPGFGPGTPFLEDASEELRRALDRYDFEAAGSDALTTILAQARNVDSITLWHLLFRTSADDRERVYDRLAGLVPAPHGVTRDGMLAGDPQMIGAWQKHLNLGMKLWWKFSQ